MRPKLELVAKFIGNKDWALGYLTVTDFWLAEFSHYFEKTFPEEYKKFPFFQTIRERFEALPEIKTYYQQEKAVKGPFTTPTAKVQF